MIIRSLLDQDFYKFTMGQAVLHQFPAYWVKYRFRCRTPGIVWTPAMLAEINAEIDAFCELRFTEDELSFLSSIRFLKPYYIDFLRLYQPQRSHIKISLGGSQADQAATGGGEGLSRGTPDGADEDDLKVEIEGPWFLTIYFEMPLLSIVNEVYFRNRGDFEALAESGRRRLAEKIRLARQAEPGFRFSDFGTRRRYSRAWQEEVVKTLCAELPKSIFVGSSNVQLSKAYKISPIGTMAHEYIQAGQASNAVPLAKSQSFMLQKWVDEYRGDLGIALSDTLGTPKFLKDFDLYFAKLYDGLRHDSGDPALWAETVLAHYRSLKIDPRTKTLVFSDSLDFPRALELYARFKDQCQILFGIGTNLTNDFDGVEPLQIVVKLVSVNDKPVAKLSDNPAKTMCDDPAFLAYLRSVI